MTTDETPTISSARDPLRRVPRFRPGVYLRDRAGERLLLLPEGYIELDEVAWDILRLVDGQRNVAAIVTVLATQYEGDPTQIRNDVLELLEQLHRDGVLTWQTEPL